MNQSYPRRLIRLPAVRDRTGLSRAAIYAAISAGTFPRQVKTGERSVAWVEDEIDTFVEMLVTKRDAKHTGGAPSLRLENGKVCSTMSDNRDNSRSALDYSTSLNPRMRQN